MDPPSSSVTEASVHTPIYNNSTYVQMVRQSIYKTRRPEHPHLPIRQYERIPQGPPSRPCYMKSCPYMALTYTTDNDASTFSSTFYHNNCNHCTAASRACPLLHQVSDISAIIGIVIGIGIGIGSSVLAAVSDWIWLTYFSIWLYLMVFGLIILTYFSIL